MCTNDPWTSVETQWVNTFPKGNHRLIALTMLTPQPGMKNKTKNSSEISEGTPRLTPKA